MSYESVLADEYSKENYYKDVEAANAQRVEDGEAAFDQASDTDDYLRLLREAQDRLNEKLADYEKRFDAASRTEGEDDDSEGREEESKVESKVESEVESEEGSKDISSFDPLGLYEYENEEALRKLGEDLNDADKFSKTADERERRIKEAKDRYYRERGEAWERYLTRINEARQQGSQEEPQEESAGKQKTWPLDHVKIGVGPGIDFEVYEREQTAKELEKLAKRLEIETVMDTYATSEEEYSKKYLEKWAGFLFKSDEKTEGDLVPVPEKWVESAYGGSLSDVTGMRAIPFNVNDPNASEAREAIEERVVELSPLQ